MIDCAKKIFKQEGYKGYINGLKPCLLKAVLGDGIGIVVYEKCQEALSKLKVYWDDVFNRSSFYDPALYNLINLTTMLKLSSNYAKSYIRDTTAQ